MTSYVVGFMFNEAKDAVVLIHPVSSLSVPLAKTVGILTVAAKDDAAGEFNPSLNPVEEIAAAYTTPNSKE